MQTIFLCGSTELVKTLTIGTHTGTAQSDSPPGLQQVPWFSEQVPPMFEKPRRDRPRAGLFWFSATFSSGPTIKLEAMTSTTGPRNGSATQHLVVDAVNDDEEAQRTFSLSILVSAVRCTLTYVIFPFVLPFAGLAEFGSVVGVVLSTVAIVANVSSIRRMHAAQHKWRVPVTVINIAMIGLVVTLLVLDLFNLFG